MKEATWVASVILVILTMAACSNDRASSTNASGAAVDDLMDTVRQQARDASGEMMDAAEEKGDVYISAAEQAGDLSDEAMGQAGKLAEESDSIVPESAIGRLNLNL